jgi:hypothetical protein
MKLAGTRGRKWPRDFWGAPHFGNGIVRVLRNGGATVDLKGVKYIAAGGPLYLSRCKAMPTSHS